VNDEFFAYDLNTLLYLATRYRQVFTNEISSIDAIQMASRMLPRRNISWVALRARNDDVMTTLSKDTLKVVFTLDKSFDQMLKFQVVGVTL